MGRAIQIRNVPESLHRQLKARAALEGISLSEWLLRELRRVAEEPSRAELLARLEARAREAIEPAAAKIVREERERG
jgi:plasmid stability protein